MLETLPALSARRLHPTFVAEIAGVDASEPLEASIFDWLREMTLEHQILVLRDQRITPRQHVAFAERFGHCEVNLASHYNIADEPQLIVLTNERLADGSEAGLNFVDKLGTWWHVDATNLPLPTNGSLLHGVKIPPDGGDTGFANMYAAYDAVSPEMQRRIRGLRALHAATPQNCPGFTEEELSMQPRAVHPLVRIHPITGKRSLYIGELAQNIVGLGESESADLLAELKAHGEREDFVYMHRWQQGDLVYWDNRCTMHRATDYDQTKYVRRMHRASFSGEIPFGDCACTEAEDVLTVAGVSR